MEMKGNKLFFAVYDEENEDYGEPQEFKGVQEVELSYVGEARNDCFPLSSGIEGTLTIKNSNIRTMSPTLRNYFKVVSMNGKLYL